MQHYSDPKRETDPHALPDVETIHYTAADIAKLRLELRNAGNDPDDALMTEPGWYYWYCLPGCLPDGMAVGPFKSEAEALADMRDNADTEED